MLAQKSKAAGISRVSFWSHPYFFPFNLNYPLVSWLEFGPNAGKLRPFSLS